MRATENEQAELSLALLGLSDRDCVLLRLTNGGPKQLRAALIKEAIRF